jgi:mRNA interferase RelE/StbE
VGDYFLAIKPSARKELDGLPENVLARAVAKIESLANSPRPAGCKKLKGHKDQWRIRVGDWRIVYIIDDQSRVVRVTHIAHRRDVYET